MVTQLKGADLPQAEDEGRGGERGSEGGEQRGLRKLLLEAVKTGAYFALNFVPT